MFPQINSRQSFPALELEMLAYWKANDTFKKSLEIREGAPEFNFYDGPPFATGTPHYGHLLAGTIKDVIPRYQTMQGKYVERRFGWDCHGLPIENIVEKKLGISGKKDIEDKLGVFAFNEECRANVFGYTDVWRQTVERMGRWVDMDNDYKTMDTDFMESVWWVFKSIYDKGYVYESYRVVPYCPRCSTPLSNFEVNQGYEDKQDKAVTVKFKVKGTASKYVLAWTTTPWTLPANLGLAVGTDIQYVEILDKATSETYVLAADRLGTYYKNPEDYTLVREYSGSCLVGLEYEPMFDDFVTLQEAGTLSKDVEMGKNAYHVVSGHHVTTDSGTGVVHIAPAYGEDDFQIGKKEGLGFISHIDSIGHTTGLLSDNDVYVFDYNQIVIDRLKTEKKLVHIGTIDHSYPHCYRCKTPLIYRAISAWYVNVESLKDRMVANNQKVNWMPDNIKDGRFGKWVEGARDWNISRNRYWGSTIPVWKSEDGDIQVVGSVEELYQGNKEFGDITKVILVRHGKTDYNGKKVDVVGKAQLIDEGYLHAEKIKDELQNTHIDAIYCSPFQRCIDTISPLSKEKGINLVIDDDLKEFQILSSQEKAGAEMHKQMLTTSVRIEGDESVDELLSRTEKFLKKVVAENRGKTIVICSHFGTIAALQKCLYGFDWDAEYKKYTLTNRMDHKDYRSYKQEYVFSNTSKSVDLHKHYVDTIKLSKNGKSYIRVPEVLDCWFESGSMPYAQKHYPFDNKERFENTFPADFIAEGLDQTRGWFYTLLILGTALFEDTPFLNVIVNGIILAEDGKKMSKSLKNYPDPLKLVEKHGADALRFYMLSSPAVKADDLRFSEAGVEEVVKKVLLPLWNTYSFFTTYANIDAWTPSGTRFTLMRHGETDANAGKRISDALELSPLNAKGIEQAHKAGAQMKEEGKEFDIIIASTAERAKKTAQIVAEEIGYTNEIIIMPEFIERHAGECSGKSHEEVETWYKEKTGKDLGGPYHYKAAYEHGGGEHESKHQMRVEKAITELMEKYPGKKILVVAHGGTFRAFNTHFLSLTMEEGYQGSSRVGNAGYRDFPSVKLTNKLDTWIISRLNRLAAMVSGGFEAYDLQIPTRAITEFMDDLTNWYIRRSRRRFWKSENDGDKMEAYETLYHVLVTLAKVMAPITPMISEAVFRGLTNRESVHLERFPEATRAHMLDGLEASMKGAREIITLGLALRGQKKIRVRQPLASITIGENLSEYFQEIIREELNVKEVKIEDMSHVARKICKPNAKLIGPRFGKAVQDVIVQAKLGNFEEFEGGRIQVGQYLLEAGEYEIAYEPLSGVTLDVMSGTGIVIAMDMELTSELEMEGMARDIIRVVQDLRKQKGYNVTDKIFIEYGAPHILVSQIVKLFGSYIQAETLAEKIDIKDFSKIGWDYIEGGDSEGGMGLGVTIRKVG